MTALDDIAGKLGDRKTEESAATVLLGEHAEQLIEHEGRIMRLEQAAA